MFPVRTAYKRGHLSMLQCNVGVVTPTYDLCLPEFVPWVCAQLIWHKLALSLTYYKRRSMQIHF
jgi:hypothetical protein